ncbi:MAG: phosphoenolpyruvate synthase [Bacteroidota bacterium]
MKKFIAFFHEISQDHIHEVGGKNASLGEMTRTMSELGIQVPGGFAIKTNAYKEFIKHHRIDKIIARALSDLRVEDIAALQRAGEEIRETILEAELPAEVQVEIAEAYQELSSLYGVENLDVAVRSSATAEDLPNASFAGQQETYLNVSKIEEVLLNTRRCYASLFTDRSISYRESRGYNHMEVYLSIGIQKMVRSDLATSGVAFSIDTESGFKDTVLITSSYGLGELLVQGTVSPDEYLVFKPTRSIIEKKLGSKKQRMVYAGHSGRATKIEDVPEKYQHQFCLSEEQILQVAEWVQKVENYYSTLHQRWCPVDVEWAFDGFTDDLFLLQARPETIHSNRLNEGVVYYELENSADLKRVVEGIAVGERIGVGRVRVMHNVKEAAAFRKGDVLVTDMTDPDWEPVMKLASGIVTNRGGRTCHAAIVSREIGVPAIVGTGNGVELLNGCEQVTVSCAEGEKGFVYDGICEFKKHVIELEELPQTKTPLMLNVASPDLAFKYSFLPNKGVGLAREEFIINNYIKVHPMALLKHRELGDPVLSRQIAELCRGYASEKEFFITKLAHGIAKIGAAFYDKPVIVRFSDFKSNEYSNLLGGEHFEPREENPMIGWRGASRYYSDAYKEAFGLECYAIKKVREEMGLKNVIVMIPFCRTVEECQSVLETMKEYGLERGKNGLEVYLMAEIPSNIILAEQFARYVDGFSIGSNDLTQLTLGLDRDSNLVSHLYDERNPAVKELNRQLTDTAKRSNRKVGICGQAPSDFPDFAQFLVELGIDSISVTPDSILKTLQAISAIETKLRSQV